MFRSVDHSGWHAGWHTTTTARDCRSVQRGSGCRGEKAEQGQTKAKLGIFIFFSANYTFIFNLSIEEILKRLKKRKIKNKYDKIDINFHKKVISGYKKISNSKRYINIDASLSKNLIHKNILNLLNI